MEHNNSTMTNTDTDNLFSQLEKRFGNIFLKKRLRTQKSQSVIKRMLSYIIYRENLDPKYLPLKFTLILTGLFKQATLNTMEYEIDYQDIFFDNLPQGFHGLKILHLSDIHIEGIPDKGKRLSKILSKLDYNLCLITGDYRFLSFGDYSSTIENMKTITDAVDCKYGITGVLGNHDYIDMLPDLESIGIRMLVNESQKLVNNDDYIWIAGVDNPSFHTCTDISKSLRQVSSEEFTIFLAHSPCLIKKANKSKVDYYLCGHTHGGQLCLPGKRPIITKAKCARRYAIGPWTYKNMKGYTSSGVGTSGLPVRLNCPPQITIHTLMRS